MKRINLAMAVMALGLTAFAYSSDALSQASGASSTTQIVVTGEGELFAPADEASFSIGITSEASTAATASADNAQLSKLVLDALKRAQLNPADLLGTHLSVRPKWAYESYRPKRKGYLAENVVKIKTSNLEAIGSYIDAALESGATDISDIEFSTRETTALRRKALEQAVADARGNAEAIARAGGGSLGALLELSTQRPDVSPGVRMEEIVVTAQRRVDKSVDTLVIPSQTRIIATIIARWSFVPGNK